MSTFQPRVQVTDLIWSSDFGLTPLLPPPAHTFYPHSHHVSPGALTSPDLPTTYSSLDLPLLTSTQPLQQSTAEFLNQTVDLPLPGPLGRPHFRLDDHNPRRVTQDKVAEA
jgi:hypothetical protein